MQSHLNFLASKSHLAQLMRAHDWSRSSLGDPAQWPESLKVVVNLMLQSKTPKFLAWGPELCMLYNDAYLEILGARHPAALGAPLREVWTDVWPEVAGLVERTLNGEPLYIEDAAFQLRRNDADTVAYISFAYAPLYQGDAVAGLYCDLHETTDKVLAAQNRIAENNRLQLLFEQSPGMIVVVHGPDHVITTANQNYRAFVGNRPLLGLAAAEALPELAEQGFVSLLDDVVRAGQVYHGEAVAVRVRQGEGEELTERRVSFVYQPIRDAAGQIEGIFVEGFDVTDLVRSRQAAQESEQRLRQLANTIPQLAWIADSKGEVIWYNDRWYAYTGRSADDMIGARWHSVMDPVMLPLIRERWQHCVDTGEPFEMTFPVRQHDGAFRPFFTLAAPLRDAEGTIVQWFGTNTDVSSLEQARADLQRTEAWLDDGLVAGRMVVWEWDLLTQQVRYSANARDVLGYADGDAARGRASIHPDDAARLSEAVNRAVQTSGAFHEVTRRVRPDNGKQIWIESKGRVVTGPGDTPYMRGIMVDLTERVKAEQELLSANQRKDEFLAMLAHELRNPLAPISTAAQLLRVGQPTPAQVSKASEVISRQVTHMTELVDDLLDVSRVTRGLVQLDKQALDMGVVVRNALEQAAPLIEAREHRVALVLPPEPVIVLGDQTRLVQVLANLLNNAAKYTPRGGRISVGMMVENGQCTLKVSDTGQGIDATLLPHVFDLFSQAARTPDRAQGGLGLGLALVKSIMLLHGGKVEACSAGIGLGSVFTLTLPVIAAPAGAEATAAAVRVDRNAAPLALVLVDDNADAAESLAALLGAMGHVVSVYAEPFAALTHPAARWPDVFILDIGLPGIDGYELVRRLRARQQDGQKPATFIALTGYGQSHDKVLAMAAGFDHYLVKPVTMLQLAAILQDVAR